MQMPHESENKTVILNHTHRKGKNITRAILNKKKKQTDSFRSPIHLRANGDL